MKKVLFVIRSLKGGGAERALSNIVTHFPEDWQIDILVDSEKVVDYPYKGNLISLGMDNCKNRKSPLFYIEEMIKKIKCLKKLKRENDYEACISFLDTSNIANILSGNKYCKTVISIRVSMISKESKWLYRLGANVLMRSIYNRADKIVAVSKEIAEEMQSKFKCSDKVITSIVNGYDNKSILEQTKREPENIIDIYGKKVVITVGRLDEQKGQWHLIRAFQEVVKREKNVLLLIFGTGQLRAYYEELIEKLGLQKNVILGGFCENPYWYEAKANVFVLPSMYEGYPNALAEAICCGVPCIATDFHSGAREILAPDMNIFGKRVTQVTETQYGILTPLCSGKQYTGEETLEKEEKQLADAITMLLTDEKKNQYYIEQSKRRRESLGINEIVKEWIRVIEE